MEVYIKNPHATNTINYQGQDIDPTEYYLIPSDKLIRWQTDSVLLADIGSATAIVARDNTGNEDISDVNDAIEYLKQLQPRKVENVAIADPNGKRARLKGSHYATATANTTTSSDFLIPQLQYLGSNVNSIFNGVQYYAKDATLGDSITFQIVDKDGSGVGLGLYPQAYYDAYKDANGVLLVEEFGDDWYIAPNSCEDIILYRAAMLPGLYMRVIYNNTHATNTVSFIINIFRHIEA